MLSLSRIRIIKFDFRDWENGFFVTFQIPFSLDNYNAIVAMPTSSNITLIP